MKKNFKQDSTFVKRIKKEVLLFHDLISNQLVGRISC